MKSLLFFLFAIYSTVAFGQSEYKTLLRFDGFYETTCSFEEGDDEGGQDYLRFYANAKVIRVYTECEGTVDEMKSWFKLDTKPVITFDYKLTGRRIFFSSKNNSDDIKYKGLLKKNGLLKLKWKSSINGKRGHQEYKFVQIAGLT